MFIDCLWNVLIARTTTAWNDNTHISFIACLDVIITNSGEDISAKQHVTRVKFQFSHTIGVCYRHTQKHNKITWDISDNFSQWAKLLITTGFSKRNRLNILLKLKFTVAKNISWELYYYESSWSVVCDFNHFVMGKYLPSVPVYSWICVVDLIQVFG